MNTEEIIEMAEKAGFTLPEGETWYEAFPQCIEDFAKLVEDATQQRKPLTDEEIEQMWERTGDYDSFARAIEAAHGIKE